MRRVLALTMAAPLLAACAAETLPPSASAEPEGTTTTTTAAPTTTAVPTTTTTTTAAPTTTTTTTTTAAPTPTTTAAYDADGCHVAALAEQDAIRAFDSSMGHFVNALGDYDLDEAQTWYDWMAEEHRRAKQLRRQTDRYCEGAPAAAWLLVTDFREWIDESWAGTTESCRATLHELGFEC